MSNNLKIRGKKKEQLLCFVMKFTHTATLHSRKVHTASQVATN